MAKAQPIIVLILCLVLFGLLRGESVVRQTRQLLGFGGRSPKKSRTSHPSRLRPSLPLARNNSHRETSLPRPHGPCFLWA